MPPHSRLCHFKDGITKITNGTGGEAKEMVKTFVPLIAGSQPAKVVAVVRSLVDFLYRAHRPQLHEEDLAALERNLAEFHSWKDIFRSAGLFETKALFKGHTQNTHVTTLCTLHPCARYDRRLQY